MEQSFDVVALGELLIDFTENGVSAQGNTLFEACPGGAPCNVLAMLRKLHRRCAFVGKVGDDLFGRLLKGVLEDTGISTQALLMDKDIPTTLAFVKTAPNGDRDFSFYRKPGADMMLRQEELPLEMLKKTRIFHFGTTKGSGRQPSGPFRPPARPGPGSPLTPISGRPCGTVWKMRKRPLPTAWASATF